jgi:restriction system protein
MPRSSLTNVAAAFDMVLEEIEAEIDLVTRAGARAMEGRDFESAHDALQRAGQLTAFRERADALQREWATLVGQSAEEEGEGDEEQASRRDLGRLRRGLRTPEPPFYRPILEALVSLGGRASMAEVLENIERRMQGVLRDVDFQPLASDPELPRWRNTAQWARHAMVKDGRLRSDSPRGIWEISNAGRRSLERGGAT